MYVVSHVPIQSRPIVAVKDNFGKFIFDGYTEAVEYSSPLAVLNQFDFHCISLFCIAISIIIIGRTLFSASPSAYTGAMSMWNIVSRYMTPTLRTISSLSALRALRLNQ